MTINKFRGEYDFLSNFYPCKSLVIKGDKFATVEHAFQAAKTLDQNEREIIRVASSAAEAKRLGKNVDLRHDWNSIKLDVMSYLVKEKFKQDAELEKMLLDTEGVTLIEGNEWHDNFWGDCYCDRCARIFGMNKLGEILMKVRQELRLANAKV